MVGPRKTSKRPRFRHARNAAFLFLFLFAIDTLLAQGRMFWVDYGRASLSRATLEGRKIKRLVSRGLVSPFDLALDLNAGKIYWTDIDAGKIQRADLKGRNVEDLVTAGISGPLGIAVDAKGGKMYWTDIYARRIQRANLDGSHVETLIDRGLSLPYGIALDLKAKKIYWTDDGTDKVQRANLDGSNVEDVVTSGLKGPVSVAVDPEAGYVYWVDFFYGKIQRARLNGSGVEDVISDDLDPPFGIALDPENRQLYWTAFGTQAKIVRANYDGSGATVVLDRRLGSPVSLALDVQSTVEPPALDDVVLLADRLVQTYGPRKIAGNVYSNGQVRLARGAGGEVDGNVTAVRDVSIAARNRVLGDVSAGGSVVNQGTVTGSIVEGAAVGRQKLPRLGFRAGRTAINVGRRKQVMLPPGRYGKVVVQKLGVLSLESGEYSFQELHLQSRARLELDVGAGPVTVNVKKELSFGKRSAVEVMNGSSERVAFNSSQSRPLHLYREADVYGTLTAPKAEVVLGEGAGLKGAVRAAVITVDRGATVLHHSAAESLPKRAPADLDDAEDTPEPVAALPEVYDLGPNYPNPFNPTTTIPFAVPQAGEVTVAIYNLRGQLVKTLFKGPIQAGRHKVVWDGTNETGLHVASGWYVYRLQANGFVAHKKLLLAK